IKYAKNFKDLTRERLRMNARLEVKKDPKVLAIEAKLKDTISLNVEKQPLSLTYRVEDEVLLITSPGSTAQMYSHTYYVGDLIMPGNKGQPNPVAAVTSQMGVGPNSA